MLELKDIAGDYPFEYKDLEENLKTLQNGKPYMIRNDGEVFDCGVLHPYILYNVLDGEMAALCQTLSSAPPTHLNGFTTTQGKIG